jgi:uridine phosphorylase
VSLPPILDHKRHDAPSVFEPVALLREARRQKSLAITDVPGLCVLDPDGDILRRLKQLGAATRMETWPCYHTDLYSFPLAGRIFGIVACAVGAPFAVLVAEELFACGCELLMSVTSAGQITPAGRPPYFVIIDRAEAAIRAHVGSSWTTDAPFRETAEAIEAARAKGVFAVEMEAAALYTFAKKRNAAVLCLAQVTNTMGLAGQDFEKGEAQGADHALQVLEVLAGNLQ